jgi:hypothetical protein
MRPGEVHGRDYFFVTKQQFEEWIEGGKLLEHAVVYGEYKGIPMQQVGGRGAGRGLRGARARGEPAGPGAKARRAVPG